MSIRDLNEKRAVLEGIPVDELKEPATFPVDIYIRESEMLHNVFKDDFESFKTVGFKEEAISELAVRIGALREAGSLWLTFRFNREEARRLWDIHSVEGYKLRDRLLATLRVAYRNDTLLTGRLKVIASGRGHADMVQDINDLAVLGRNNPEPLRLINFDFTLLEQAAATAAFLGDILGRFDADNKKGHRVKRLRDAAYTHLLELVDEIRLFGKYLFHDEKDKKLRYYSDYLRNKKRKSILKTKRLEKQKSEVEQQKEKVKEPVELPSSTVN